LALELAEIAAGLPLAASFAMAGGITALREGRRRSSLNEAMHELRRPLQGLALALPADRSTREAVESSLRMAAAALERLDREINGEAAATASTSVRLRPLVESAVGRWRGRAAREGGSLTLRWSAGEQEVRGDAIELAQAVDNLISNAIEHGGARVVVDVRADRGILRLTVRDGGAGGCSGHRARARLRDRLGGRARHGHGLRIVRRVAARHGGSFRLRRSARGSEARLDLPLIGDFR
jgi:signal transduction histidine kinase